MSYLRQIPPAFHGRIILALPVVLLSFFVLVYSVSFAFGQSSQSATGASSQPSGEELCAVCEEI